MQIIADANMPGLEAFDAMGTVSGGSSASRRPRRLFGQAQQTVGK